LKQLRLSCGSRTKLEHLGRLPGENMWRYKPAKADCYGTHLYSVEQYPFGGVCATLRFHCRNHCQAVVDVSTTRVIYSLLFSDVEDRGALAIVTIRRGRVRSVPRWIPTRKSQLPGIRVCTLSEPILTIDGLKIYEYFGRSCHHH
jgi:hypothetical protein